MAYAISFAQSKVKIDAESDYYFETKDYFSAIYFYNMSLEKDSVNFDKWYNLAESYRFTHQYSKGILAYQKVLSSNQWSQYPNTHIGDLLRILELRLSYSMLKAVYRCK